MSTLALVEFLCARLDEDEAVAREAIRSRDAEIARGATFTGPDLTRPMLWDDWMGGPGIRLGAEVLLAECEAKRRIVNAHRSGFPDEDRYAMGWHDMHVWALCNLAAVYADHPDYRPEWRS